MVTNDTVYPEDSQWISKARSRGEVEVTKLEICWPHREKVVHEKGKQNESRRGVDISNPFQ